jgi:predicted permease
VSRSRIDHEINEELRFHIDAYANDLVQQGMLPAEAERKARIELGRVDTQNEMYREAVGLRLFDEIGADIRYGLRSLFRNPGYSAVAVLSLALGIGATTAMFSLIYAALLHPFPYKDSDRIMNPVVVDEQHPEVYRWFAMTEAQAEIFRKARCIDGILGFTLAQGEITGNALPEDASVIYLTENADTFFGVRALLGRGIQASDAHSRQPIAVLNYRLWQRRYSGDPGVIGRTLQLDHKNYTIVGVMPRSFAFNDMTGPADLYLPRSLLDSGDHLATSGAWLPWVRLKKGVSPSAADQELGVMVHQFAKEVPAHYPKQFHVQLQPVLVPFQQNSGHTLFLLLASVVLLLLIGCANCSILLLARGAARQHELAVRSALGASRWRIVRQLLLESLVLSFSGAILGVAASYRLAQLPLQLSPASFPAESVIHINLPILAFSVALALASGILFGLAPALRLSRPDLARTMQSTLRRIAGSHRSLHVLIAGQIAMTLLLMATAGLAMNTFLDVMRLPLGYNPKNVLQVGIMMHWGDPKVWQSLQPREPRAAYIERIRERIALVPGVVSAAVGTDAAPPWSGIEHTVVISGSRQQSVRVLRISPEYFSTLGIPLLRGRLWDSAENARGDGVAIVNESFARHYLAQGNAFAQQLRVPDLKSPVPLAVASSGTAGWRQIVGVVGDARNDGVSMPVVPAIYVPYSTAMEPYAQLEIRTRGEPLSFLNAVRAAVESVSSDQQVSNGAFDLEQAIERDAQWSRQRFFSILWDC